MADCKDIYEYLDDSFNEKKFENKNLIRIEDIWIIITGTNVV
jgi:hypothetical protein